MKTKVIQCQCKHDYQDQKYGKQMRVHNRAKDEGNFKVYRCTVCSSTKKQ